MDNIVEFSHTKYVGVVAFYMGSESERFKEMKDACSALMYVY